MTHRDDDQQRRQQLLTIVDRGNVEQLFNFLQTLHRRPFRNIGEALAYEGVIDEQIDIINCSGTRYHVTPLIIAAGKGSLDKAKILLVHGADPNKQCATGDTALNLAVHRQKYHMVELLLKYKANPNIYNQSGKTALHRAAASYIDENANHVRALLYAGADPTFEDRSQRTPLDEAVSANKPEIVSILLSHDRTLAERAYRSIIIAARLGHDRCLEALLNYGVDPNISDRTRTTPLHVAVRSLKLSAARILVARGANPNAVNNRGETPISLAEYLQPDQQQSFLNVLIPVNNMKQERKRLQRPSKVTISMLPSESRSRIRRDTPRVDISDFDNHENGTISGNAIPYVHPLLRSHSNWILDSEDFRSATEANSSVQNLLDTSSGTYWCSIRNRDAWVIFDLKYQHNISGMRIIGCDNQSTPRSGHIDVSNAFNGPWLKVQEFTCPSTAGNMHDVFFSPFKTRFIRVVISDNYGGNDIRVQGIGFYGVDMRLLNLLREYGLERSLHTLLANGINDLEILDERRDEILNSSDQFLHVNDHFQFIRLTESLRTPRLASLEWFNPPQTTAIAGDRLQTFSAIGNEGVTDRVKLEEMAENSSQPNTVLMRDLEPIQGRSLVDFPDYVIKTPGRYKIRVVSDESPNIHTQWHDIVVGAKPTTVVIKEPDNIHKIPNGIRPPVPSTTPPTDIEDGMNGKPGVDSWRHIPKTPRPRPGIRSNGEDEDSDSKSIGRTRPSPVIPPKPKLVDESTQSEEKTTRNAATMHEPTPTRNFGNEVQPQSSSTQTSFPSRPKPYKPIITYIERPSPPEPSCIEPYPDQRIYLPPQKTHRRTHEDPDDATPYEYIRPRSPSLARQTIHYKYDPRCPCYDTRMRDRVVRYPCEQQHYHPIEKPVYQLPPTITYQPTTIINDGYRSQPMHRSPTSSPIHRTRTPSPIQRSHTPSPIRRPHTPSCTRPIQYFTPPRRPRSATPRRRPPMYSQETDTSLDAMRRKHHVGVQYEPRPTKEKGTTPSLRTKPQLRHYPTYNFEPCRCPHERYSSPHSTLPKTHDPSWKVRCTQPATYDDYSTNYQDVDQEEDDEIRSMHDQSTMADLLVHLDHCTQCDSQPHMADRYMQTTPILDEYYQDNMIGYPEEEYIRELPRGGSISISQPVVVQPDSLPRRHPPYSSPSYRARDGLDYTGGNIEVPVHRARQQQTHDSPILNIGTEHFITPPPSNEYVTPFETHFVYESECSSTVRSKNNDSTISPTLNSPRTHIFSNNQPVRQSKNNGNFYLSTPGKRSVNSSFHVGITANQS